MSRKLKRIMLYTAQQAAQMLKCHPTQISRMVQAGKLIAEPREGKSHLKFKKSTLNEFKKTYVNRIKNPRGSKVQSSNPESIPVIFKQMTKKLDSLEQKIDQLIQMWS